MANFVYAKAKQAILNGQFNFSSDTFKVAFVKDSYIPVPSSDEFVSDIGNAKISFRTANISGITNTFRNNRRRQYDLLYSSKFAI